MKTYLKGKITIYTPTYNRAHCLPDLYESLCRQANQNFEWLIIDDGSTDKTPILVNEWLSKAPFIIKYFKQENEGKMAKLNFAHKIMDTELCVCIDSDDFLLDDTIAVILKKWDQIKEDDKLAGLVGEAIDKDGRIIGTRFPKEFERMKFRDFGKYGVKGDKIFIYRTNVISRYPPYPSYNQERFPAPGYLFRLIDEDYDLSIIDRPICVKDYLEDGLSKNKYSQFKNFPNSFRFYRHERMRLADNFAEKFRNAIHYVSSSIFAKKSIFRDNKFPLTTLLALPFGFLLYMYIKKTKKKGVV